MDTTANINPVSGSYGICPAALDNDGTTTGSIMTIQSQNTEYQAAGYILTNRLLTLDGG